MQYPHMTEDQLNQATRAYLMQIQSGFTGNTAAYDKSHYLQVSHKNSIHSQIEFLRIKMYHIFLGNGQS